MLRIEQKRLSVSRFMGYLSILIREKENCVDTGAGGGCAFSLWIPSLLIVMSGRQCIRNL